MDTPKWVPLQTVKTQMKCRIRVCTVWWNKTALQGKKDNIYFFMKLQPVSPQYIWSTILTFIACSFMENSIGPKRVEKIGFLLNSDHPFTRAFVLLYINIGARDLSYSVDIATTTANHTTDSWSWYRDLFRSEDTKYDMIWQVRLSL